MREGMRKMEKPRERELRNKKKAGPHIGSTQWQLGVFAEETRYILLSVALVANAVFVHATLASLLQSKRTAECLTCVATGEFSVVVGGRDRAIEC